MNKVRLARRVPQIAKDARVDHAVDGVEFAGAGCGSRDEAAILAQDIAILVLIEIFIAMIC